MFHIVHRFSWCIKFVLNTVMQWRTSAMNFVGCVPSIPSGIPIRCKLLLRERHSKSVHLAWRAAISFPKEATVSSSTCKLVVHSRLVNFSLCAFTSKVTAVSELCTSSRRDDFWWIQFTGLNRCHYCSTISYNSFTFSWLCRSVRAHCVSLSLSQSLRHWGAKLWNISQNSLTTVTSKLKCVVTYVENKYNDQFAELPTLQLHMADAKPEVSENSYFKL